MTKKLNWLHDNHDNHEKPKFYQTLNIPYQKYLKAVKFSVIESLSQLSEKRKVWYE